MKALVSIQQFLRKRASHIFLAGIELSECTRRRFYAKPGKPPFYSASCAGLAKNNIPHRGYLDTGPGKTFTNSFKSS